MSLCINGAPEFNPIAEMVPSFGKYTQIQKPDPTSLFVFLDVHEDEILDAAFGMPNLQYWGDVRRWWDIPANRHSQGCNFSFADGHSEHWKWRVPKSVRGTVPADELPDYRKVQNGYRQYW